MPSPKDHGDQATTSNTVVNKAALSYRSALAAGGRVRHSRFQHVIFRAPCGRALWGASKARAIQHKSRYGCVTAVAQRLLAETSCNSHYWATNEWKTSLRGFDL